MSSKRTTAPPAPEHSRSSSSGRKGLIAKKKHEKQSARKRTTLDNPFHRTVLMPALPTRRFDVLTLPNAGPIKRYELASRRIDALLPMREEPRGRAAGHVSQEYVHIAWIRDERSQARAN